MQGDGADRSERVRLREVRGLRFFPPGGEGGVMNQLLGRNSLHFLKQLLSQSCNDSIFFTITDFF